MTDASFLNTNKKIYTFLLLLVMSMCGFAQNTYQPAVESFESVNSSKAYEVTNGTLAISDAHRKYGTSSLQWEWNGESTIGTSQFKILSQEESPLDYGDFFPASPTLQMALYNETAQDGTITISFEKNGVKQVYFDVSLSFTGWRTIWVPFYEMKGNAPKKSAQVDYDYFRISTTAKSGKLFFDDIIYSQYQDDRHQYPDEIVPFIKADKVLSEDHWLPLISNYDRIKNLNPDPVSMAIRADLKQFESLIDQNLEIQKKYKLYIASVREDFEKLGLTDNGETVLGPPLTFKEHQDFYDDTELGPRKFNDIQELGKVLKKIASFYDKGNPTEQAEMKAMFLTGTKYFLDQGWVAGSNGGTRHHIGYNVRQIAEAFFIQRQLLYDNGLLKEVGASLHWLFNLGIILDEPSNFHVNIDYLNTQSYYHLMLIFLFEDQEMQAAMLMAYSNYISITLAQQNEEWGFKVDGTAWHHNGHYPAYGLGAFQSVPKIIKTLSGTRFRIGTEGHNNFKKAFLATRIYSQSFNWGFGNAGRHPLEGNGIQSLQSQFLEMAHSGNPEGTSKIDKDVAGAYLRLWGKDDVMNTALFTQVNDISKENLSGYYTFPYAATAVHRRKNWAALIKGYSKYVWASEIYVTANRYGRYQANGTIQLLNAEGEEASGFKQEGWDWNVYPGATVINMPFEELEPKTPLIMFRSNESFAGTTTLDGNGIFGMILNEEKGSNADGDKQVNLGFAGKLKAKKSVFSFDGKLITIGTNISSIDTKNPTQTNLFQSFLKNPKQALITSEDEVIKFPSDAVLKATGKQKNWIVDPYGSGYYVLSNDALHVKKKHQHSYHNKYSLSTGQIDNAAKGVKKTEGDYATAWIDHGMAPDNGAYQYVIYPFLDAKDQKNFGKMAEKDDSYTIKRADAIAHIVHDKPTNMTGYVIFEANKSLDNGILNSVSEPALIMLKEHSENNITISAVQPDLNFSKNERGKFINYSHPVALEITLNGNWSPYAKDFVKSTVHADGKTIIKLNLVNGLPGEFRLNKI
ncbi:chondroitinase family polysaccharide lyase [Gelidibacter salicanalis]|uniref:Chondroitin ABC lyase n=1 Tax=Gelidibacter salicanalis TaxID=291193 RepID=A0A934NKY3_9FLAO|nr:chondroitinase family polysaccharide lyase [Gelidibacter salicanalis]MBJ7882992.1 hypothetical protein [Gelidibacter salicanalis]